MSTIWFTTVVAVVDGWLLGELVERRDRTYRLSGKPIEVIVTAAALVLTAVLVFAIDTWD